MLDWRRSRIISVECHTRMIKMSAIALRIVGLHVLSMVQICRYVTRKPERPYDGFQGLGKD
jgi:hypothetical protein